MAARRTDGPTLSPTGCAPQAPSQPSSPPPPPPVQPREMFEALITEMKDFTGPAHLDVWRLTV